MAAATAAAGTETAAFLLLCLSALRSFISQWRFSAGPRRGESRFLSESTQRGMSEGCSKDEDEDSTKKAKRRGSC